MGAQDEERTKTPCSDMAFSVSPLVPLLALMDRGGAAPQSEHGHVIQSDKVLLLLASTKATCVL